MDFVMILEAVIAWAAEHWEAVIALLATVAALTPTDSDDRVLGRLRNLADRVRGR